VSRNLTMRLVCPKALAIRLQKFGVSLEYEQILGIFDFRLMREIEAAGDERPPIDDHDLIVRDRVMSIDRRHDPLLNQVPSSVYVSFSFALVEQDLDADAASLRVKQRLRDRLGRERIRLNQYFPRA